jgi:DNA-binding PadR family transcriptional regulator
MAHKYLILGLLAERPMTGYDIKKHVKAVLSSVMNASYGTLYPALHKLLQDGAVEMQEVPQKGRPAKKIYRITTRGRAELEEWSCVTTGLTLVHSCVAVGLTIIILLC